MTVTRCRITGVYLSLMGIKTSAIMRNASLQEQQLWTVLAVQLHSAVGTVKRGRVPCLSSQFDSRNHWKVQRWPSVQEEFDCYQEVYFISPPVLPDQVHFLCVWATNHWKSGKGKESDPTNASANTLVDSRPTVSQLSTDCWPTVGQRVGHFLNLKRTRCVGGASVTRLALSNSRNAKHTFPKLRWTELFH